MERLVEISDNESNQPKTHRYMAQPVPSSQFVVKVQVMECWGNHPTLGNRVLMVYNRDRSLQGYLSRVLDQELYDKLEEEVKKNGFKGAKGFFPAICTADAESGGFNLEINPDNILPLEIW